MLGKQAVRKGVEGTRATYTRHGEATNIDLFGYSAPGAHLQAGGSNIASHRPERGRGQRLLLRAPRSGDGHVRSGPDDRPAQPHRRAGTRSIVRLTDAVKIDEATYYNTPSDGHAKGDLVVSARTSDDQNTAPLTVVDVGSCRPAAPPTARAPPPSATAPASASRRRPPW